VLKSIGARYSPDRRAAFLHDLNIERFAPFLGTIRRSEVRFFWRSPNDDRYRPLDATWFVTLEVDEAAAQPVCYSLSFEPFEGRFQYLKRDSCS